MSRSRTRRIVTTLALAVACGLAFASSAWATSCPDADTQAAGLSQDRLENSITCLINEQRTSFGLDPVQPNGTLRRAALSHSNEMVDESYFEHTSPSGLTFIQRIESAGYMRGARAWIVGENLVWGSGALSSPGALVTAWMNSPPHRENLLKARFREIGVAAVSGTPESASDLTGTTVSSEYGFRLNGKKKATAHKAKAHKKSRKRARRHKHRRHH